MGCSPTVLGGAEHVPSGAGSLKSGAESVMVGAFYLEYLFAQYLKSNLDD